MKKMEDFKKQFKKGVVELVILKLLDEKDQYGYAIMQKLNTRSGNNIELKDGTLYPILYRLEDHKYIESYWHTEEDSRSKPRKYYKITKGGKIRFSKMYSDYKDINDGIKKILRSSRGEENEL